MSVVTFVQTSPAVNLDITAIAGTLTRGDGYDDRGGGNTPLARAGMSKSGSLQCLVEDTGDQTYVNIRTLISAKGEGAFTVSGDAVSNSAIVDVVFSGDATLTATITWKGTIA